MAEEDPDLLFTGAKKKKKKPKDPAEGGDEPKAEKAEGDAAAGADAKAAAAVTDDMADLDLGLKAKKKKKKKDTAALDLLGDGLEEATPEEAAETTAGDGGDGWGSSDRDYTYEELLDRVFGMLRDNNPELTGEKRRTILRPPQVLREGTKKTVFVNFVDMCKTLHRSNDHVLAFLLAELGTSGTLDGQQRLILKGRFLPKAFEAILRRYVNEYVLCQSCKSPDTSLERENRLYQLKCNQCGADRRVAAIKAGFQALIGKRSRMVKT